ncbi:MAG: hypothetical protein CO189_09060 [candidate division Zixibacteria bacterium CG_4_9_14_3_um_filter_46_8]|nr:MAG: hypothetical protein CO189_09060 [candidate division Zixibacteria bacterium CG_4_9_14_3_um_filter_46_8]
MRIDPKKARREKLKHAGIIISSALILLMFTGYIVDAFIMPLVIGIGDEAVVPEVTNIDSEEAKRILEENGFKWKIFSEEYSATKPRFTVLKQQPMAGLQVKRGRLVELVISKGGEIALIEDLRGFTLRQAKLRLAEDGFEPGMVTYDYDEELHPGVIIRTYPSEGSRANRGAIVDLIVNLRAGMEIVVVPNYIGMGIDSVQNDLPEKGLALGEIEYVNDDRVLPQTVLTQSLAAGIQVGKDTQISFTVSKAHHE